MCPGIWNKITGRENNQYTFRRHARDPNVFNCFRAGPGTWWILYIPNKRIFKYVCMFNCTMRCGPTGQGPIGLAAMIVFSIQYFLNVKYVTSFYKDWNSQLLAPEMSLAETRSIQPWSWSKCSHQVYQSYWTGKILRFLSILFECWLVFVAHIPFILSGIFTS